jgi:hypothetical protein
MYYNNILVFDSEGSVTPTEAPTQAVTPAPTSAPSISITGISVAYATYYQHSNTVVVDISGTFTGGTPSSWSMEAVAQSTGSKVTVTMGATTGTMNLKPDTYTFTGVYNGTRSASKIYNITSTSVTLV